MKPQLTLGAFIDLLEKQPQDHDTRYGLGYMAPGPPDSYRGYYNHLAFGIQDGPSITVAQLLAWAKEAVGKTYTGYKGGDYTMTRDTPIWAAKYGESGSSAIVGVKDRKYFTEIKTKLQDY